MCIKKERFRYSAKESALKVCCRFWWFSRLNDRVVEMIIKRQEPRNHRNQSTYKYLHPPGRRGANIRIYPFPQGGCLSAACRTGVPQRGAGGTDAKQE